MRAIRKLRNGYAVLFAAGICLTVWHAVNLMPEAALIFGASSIALFIFLVRQSRLLYDAGLILDNRILVVPSVVISISGGKEEADACETVVSTFGILVGTKIYKWGCSGVHGVRLSGIEIDRSRMYLTFGNGVELIRVEILHGMVDEQAVMEVKQKLWRETGAESVVTGW
ncbi:MAG TPA: hypothetical protein GX524_02850 [Firmicutes bacterium]|jgi:hypothetical protein|nr:hypothetical protein [Bacillota bacterium]